MWTILSFLQDMAQHMVHSEETEIDKPELEECYKLVCNLYPQVLDEQ